MTWKVLLTPSFGSADASVEDAPTHHTESDVPVLERDGDDAAAFTGCVPVIARAARTITVEIRSAPFLIDMEEAFDGIYRM